MNANRGRSHRPSDDVDPLPSADARVIAVPYGPVRHPDCYAWFVFLSSLDIMFTSIVLALGGSEVNPLVNWVLDRWGLIGIISYKFALVMFVVWVCEYIARHRHTASRRLAEWSVAITVIPVYLAIAQLLVNVTFYAE